MPLVNNAVSRNIGGGGAGAQAGATRVSAELQMRKMRQAQVEQQYKDSQASLSAFREEVFKGISTQYDQSRILLEKKMSQAKDNPELKNQYQEDLRALQAKFESNVKNAQYSLQKQYEIFDKTVAQPASKMGYISPSQVQSDQQAYITAINNFMAVPPDMARRIEVLPEAAKTEAIETAGAQAINKSITYLIPGENGKNEIIDVDATDSKTIEEIRNRGGFPFKPSVQAASTSDLSANTKATNTELEKKLISVGDSRAVLSRLKKDFKPEYFNVVNRLGLAAQKAGEKFGINMSKEDEKTFSEFKQYGQKALLFINEEIHRLTGAQMSQFEAKRIRSSIPDFGESSFSGNSATEFMANIDSLDSTLAAMQKRYEFMLKAGVISEGQEITNALGEEYPYENFVGNPKVVLTADEYAKVPPGDIFIDRSGIPKRKPK